MFCFIYAANLQAAQVVDETFRQFSGCTQTARRIHPSSDIVTFSSTRILLLFRLCAFLHLCCACARECVRRCTSVSHRVGIKAWDDPFFNEQTLHFDRSLTRHYRSLGASALLIQHPQHPHAHSQALTFTQTPCFSSQQIHGLISDWNSPGI